MANKVYKYYCMFESTQDRLHDDRYNAINTQTFTRRSGKAPNFPGSEITLLANRERAGSKDERRSPG